MRNRMYGGVRGRKTKVGGNLLLFSSYSICYLCSLSGNLLKIRLCFANKIQTDASIMVSALKHQCNLKRTKQ